MYYENTNKLIILQKSTWTVRAVSVRMSRDTNYKERIVSFKNRVIPKGKRNYTKLSLQYSTVSQMAYLVLR